MGGVALEKLIPGEHSQAALELLPHPETVKHLGRLAGMTSLGVEGEADRLQLVQVVTEGEGSRRGGLSLAFLRVILRFLSTFKLKSLLV